MFSMSPMNLRNPLRRCFMSLCTALSIWSAFSVSVLIWYLSVTLLYSINYNTLGILCQLFPAGVIAHLFHRRIFCRSSYAKIALMRKNAKIIFTSGVNSDIIYMYINRMFRLRTMQERIHYHGYQNRKNDKSQAEACRRNQAGLRSYLHRPHVHHGL